MKTVRLGIPQDEINNQYHCLPRHFTLGGVKCYIEKAPYFIVNGQDISTNVDFILTPYPENAITNWGNVIPIFHGISSHRYTKLEQWMRLRAYVEREQPKGFSPLDVYAEIDLSNEHDYSFELPEKIILKPQRGASSRGLILWPTREVSYAWFSTLGNVDKLRDEKVDAMCKKVPSFKYSKGRMTNIPPRKMFATNYREDIAQEYRMLTNGTGEVLVYARKREGKDGLVYPNDLPDVMNVPMPESEINAIPWIDEIFKAVNAMCVVGSQDVYITTDGKWGLFEYQSQYGIAGDLLEVHRKFILTGIEHRLEQLGLI